MDYTGSGSGTDIGDVAQHTDWMYDTIDLGTKTVSEVNNLRVYFQVVIVAGGDDIYVDHARIGVSGSLSSNYEIDLEIQWTNANYTRTNEELCIKTGTVGDEDIKVYAWHSSSWNLVFSDLTANSWNNISVSSYLDSSTFTVRFLGGTETGDTIESTWQIDAALLHTWEPEGFYSEITINDGTFSWISLSPGDSDIQINGLGGSDGDIDITVTATATFNVQAKGDGDLTFGGNTIPLANVEIATTIGAKIPLSTSYQNIPGLTNQEAGTDLPKSFSLWITVPSPQPPGDYVFTLTIQVTESS